MAEQQTTVLERIAQNVLTTLAGVTLSMPDGSTPALSVERQKSKTSPKHLLAVIYQSNDDRIDEAGTGTEEWMTQFAVVVYVMPLEDDPTPVDAYSNAARGALHRRIMADYQRGGLAINTTVQPPLYFPMVQGEYAGLTFNFDVYYRNALDDPFAAAT